MIGPGYIIVVIVVSKLNHRKVIVPRSSKTMKEYLNSISQFHVPDVSASRIACLSAAVAELLNE